MTGAEPYLLIMTLVFKDERDEAFTNMNWSGAAVETIELPNKSSCELAAKEWVSTVKSRGISAKTNCIRINPTLVEKAKNKEIQDFEDDLQLGFTACKNLKFGGEGTYDLKPLGSYKDNLEGRVSLLKRMGFSNPNPNISYEWFVKIVNKTFPERKILLHKDCPAAKAKLKLELGDLL